jgi:predicted permease
MLVAFLDARREAGSKGRVEKSITFWIRTLVDVACNAVLIRVSSYAKWIESRRRAAGVRRRGDSMFGEVMRNVSYALRVLAKNPAFSAIIVLTLALGFGANTTIFSMVNGLLLRPLPYPQPDNLVTVSHVYPTQGIQPGVSVPGFRDYRDRTRLFGGVGIARGWAVNLTGTGEPERLIGSRVTPGYLQASGIAPALGRLFVPGEAEAGNELVVVVSHGFWKRRLGSAPDAVGNALVLNDQSYEIVGVMPPTFRDFFNWNRELWVPLVLNPADFGDNRRILEIQGMVARLRPGVTVEAAARELTSLAETIKSELPNTYPPDWTLSVVTLDELLKRQIRPALWILFGAVGFVLLITCANVANLLLARSVGRKKEIAIRKAMGADRAQLIRQLITESVVLSVLGGLLGLLVAYWGIQALTVISSRMPTGTVIGIDVTVLLFTLFTSLGVGVLFGLAPAIQGAALDIQQALREGGQASQSDRSGQGLRRGLVVAEFALALVLLAGAGLMIRSISQLRQIDPGFTPGNLLTASIQIPNVRYPDAQSSIAFFDQLLLGLEATPGVTSAATTSFVPFSGGDATSVFSIFGYVPNSVEDRPWGEIRRVTPGFARTMGVPVLLGRFFDQSDGPDAPAVAVVDEEMVRRWWPNENPLGKRVGFGNPQNADDNWAEVIGVIGHTKDVGLDGENRVQLYFAARQAPTTGARLLIRTERDPTAMIPAARKAVYTVDSDQPISNVRIMEELISDSLGSRRILMIFLSLFSGLALFLASLGIYGVMSHLVKERSRELGLRMALGATRSGLFGLVLAGGVRLAGIGLALGLGGAVALTRLLQSQLYNVEPTDPLTLVMVAGVLLGVAVLAICLPANRAARVDPMTNLRTE